MRKLKSENSYVTFIPTETEFVLFGSIPNIVQGVQILTSDEQYLNYGFKKGVSRYVNEGSEFYYFPLNTIENLAKITNAYDLHYEADYQGERFLALVDPNNPQITLHTGDEAIARKFGFRNYSKGEWVKDIGISEIELIPVKEPIDLSTYLPRN